MAKMKLADWARKHGLSYLTANRHFHAGMIPNAHQLDSGTILVEDDSLEQTMAGNTSNDAMSLFLKKTVEFSKNNATIEDFAAYVISNFQLKISGVESPKYSKQKPKSEEVQKHFQQFIPKGEKPKPNSFVMEPEAFADEPIANVDVTKDVSKEELVKEFEQAVKYGSVVAPRNYVEDMFPGFNPTADDANAVFIGVTAAMSPTEGTVSRSVDLNTTPQQINYTGSNNLAFSGSSYSIPTAAVSASSLLHDSTLNTATINSGVLTGIASQDGLVPEGGLYFDHNPDLLSLPRDTSSEVEKSVEETNPNQPRRRGRKPSKR